MANKKISKKAAETQAKSDFLMETPIMESVPPQTTVDTSTQPLSDQELADLDSQVEMEQKFGDRSAEAAALGAARGLTFGLSDQLLTKSLGVKPETLREIEERNSTASNIGEFGTILGTTVLSGGTTAAAKAAAVGGSAVIGAERASAALGRKAAAEMFKNRAEKEIAKKIFEKSVAGAVEGSLYGTGQLISEEALGNADFTGENLVAFAGPGAVLGGFAGGAFGGLQASVPKISTAFNKATGQVKRSLGKTLDPEESAIRLFIDSPSGLAKAEEKGFKKEALDYYNNDLKGGLFTNSDELVAAHNTSKEKVKESLNKIYDDLDTGGGQLQPNKQFYRDLKNEAIEAFNAGKYADNSGYQKQLRSVINELIEKSYQPGNITFKKLRELSQRFGEEAFSKTGSRQETVKAEIYFDLWQRMKGKIDEFAETAADKTDDAGLRAKLADLKKLNRKSSFQQFVDPHLKRRAEKSIDISNIGDLSLLAGTAIGTGGNIGAVAGALTTKKFFTSDLKNRLVVLMSAERSNNQALKTMKDSITSFFSKPSGAAKRAQKLLTKQTFLTSGLAAGASPEGRSVSEQPKNEREAFKNISENLINYKVNQDKLALKIASNTMKAGYAAPNAAKFAQVTLARAVDFLYEKMPKNPNAAYTMGGARKWEPSSLQLSKFARYVQVVENPYTIFSEIDNGTLTKEHVEALQSVYPAIYQKVQGETLKAVNESNTVLPYNKKIQLGNLLSIPTDPTLAPDRILDLQMSFQPTAEPEQPDYAPQRADFTMGDRLETDTDRVQSGDTE